MPNRFLDSDSEDDSSLSEASFCDDDDEVQVAVSIQPKKKEESKQKPQRSNSASGTTSKTEEETPAQIMERLRLKHQSRKAAKMNRSFSHSENRPAAMVECSKATRNDQSLSVSEHSPAEMMERVRQKQELLRQKHENSKEARINRSLNLSEHSLRGTQQSIQSSFKEEDEDVKKFRELKERKAMKKKKKLARSLSPVRRKSNPTPLRTPDPSLDPGSATLNHSASVHSALKTKKHLEENTTRSLSPAAMRHKSNPTQCNSSESLKQVITTNSDNQNIKKLEEDTTTNTDVRDLNECDSLNLSNHSIPSVSSLGMLSEEDEKFRELKRQKALKKKKKLEKDKLARSLSPTPTRRKSNPSGAKSTLNEGVLDPSQKRNSTGNLSRSISTPCSEEESTRVQKKHTQPAVTTASTEMMNRIQQKCQSLNLSDHGPRVSHNSFSGLLSDKGLDVQKLRDLKKRKAMEKKKKLERDSLTTSSVDTGALSDLKKCSSTGSFNLKSSSSKKKPSEEDWWKAARLLEQVLKMEEDNSKNQGCVASGGSTPPAMKSAATTKRGEVQSTAISTPSKTKHETEQWCETLNHSSHSAGGSRVGLLSEEEEKFKELKERKAMKKKKKSERSLSPMRRKSNPNRPRVDQSAMNPSGKRSSTGSLNNAIAGPCSTAESNDHNPPVETENNIEKTTERQIHSDHSEKGSNHSNQSSPSMLSGEDEEVREINKHKNLLAILKEKKKPDSDSKKSQEWWKVAKLVEQVLKMEEEKLEEKARMTGRGTVRATDHTTTEVQGESSLDEKTTSEGRNQQQERGVDRSVGKDSTSLDQADSLVDDEPILEGSKEEQQQPQEGQGLDRSGKKDGTKDLSTANPSLNHSRLKSLTPSTNSLNKLDSSAADEPNPEGSDKQQGSGLAMQRDQKSSNSSISLTPEQLNQLIADAVAKALNENHSGGAMATAMASSHNGAPKGDKATACDSASLHMKGGSCNNGPTAANLSCGSSPLPRKKKKSATQWWESNPATDLWTQKVVDVVLEDANLMECINGLGDIDLSKNSLGEHSLSTGTLNLSGSTHRPQEESKEQHLFEQKQNEENERAMGASALARATAA